VDASSVRRPGVSASFGQGRAKDAPLPQLAHFGRSALGAPSSTHGPSSAGAHPTRTIRPVRAQCARRLSWGFVPLQRLPSHTATESSSRLELRAAGSHLRLVCASAVSTTLTPSSAWDLVRDHLDTHTAPGVPALPHFIVDRRSSAPRFLRDLHCYLPSFDLSDRRPKPPAVVAELRQPTQRHPRIPLETSSRPRSSGSKTSSPDVMSEAVRLSRVFPRRKRRVAPPPPSRFFRCPNATRGRAKAVGYASEF